MADQLPARKVDIRPLAAGADPTHYIRATDYNALLDHTKALFDVTSYGAVGDGVADDSVAIQAAINACEAAGGGTVIVPAGVFKHATTITTRNYVNVRGSGKNQTIFLYTGNVLAWDAQGTGVNGPATYKIHTLSDFMIVGNNPGGASINAHDPTNDAIGFRFAWNMRSYPLLERVSIFAFGKYGIEFTDQEWQIWLVDVEMQWCGTRQNVTGCAIRKSENIPGGCFNHIVFERCSIEACGTITSSIAGAVQILSNSHAQSYGVDFLDCCIEGNFGFNEFYAQDVLTLNIQNLYSEIISWASEPSRNIIRIQDCTANITGSHFRTQPANVAGVELLSATSTIILSGNRYDTRYGGGDVSLDATSVILGDDVVPTLRVVSGITKGYYAPLMSANRGDADVTLVSGVDEPVQRFATVLTANRTVTLSATNARNGGVFRVVRAVGGDFTMDVGGLKTIPVGTIATVDVIYDGTAWRLAAYEIRDPQAINTGADGVLFTARQRGRTNNPGLFVSTTETGTVTDLNASGSSGGKMTLSAAGALIAALDSNGFALSKPLSPCTDASAAQAGRIFQGSGVPSNANGSNGDIYFRTDTPGTANQRLYCKAAGAWAGIL